MIPINSTLNVSLKERFFNPLLNYLYVFDLSKVVEVIHSYSCYSRFLPNVLVCLSSVAVLLTITKDDSPIPSINFIVAATFA